MLIGCDDDKQALFDTANDATGYDAPMAPGIMGDPERVLSATVQPLPWSHQTAVPGFYMYKAQGSQCK